MENSHFSGMYKFLKENYVKYGFVWRHYSCPEVSVRCNIRFADLTKGEKEPTHWECEYEYDGFTETRTQTFEELSDYFQEKINQVRNNAADFL